jgi:hypothetical protein
VTVSGADSVRVRVHPYERRFRRKPVKRVPADELHVGVTHDTCGALGDVTHEARFCYTRSAVLPDDSDLPLGRERPRLFRSGTSAGGWQRGSLTPQMSRSLPQTAAFTATQAAQSAARCTAAKSFTRKDIDQSISSQPRSHRRAFRWRAARPKGGTQLPSLCSPCFSSIEVQQSATSGMR